MRLLALLMPLALAACLAETPPDPGTDIAPLPPEGSCGAPELQGLVGQPALVLETMRFATTVRVIYPGMAVTMDYQPQRLNIEVDEDKTISRVSCG